MASIIKFPTDTSRGVLIFTTPERDLYIRKSLQLESLIAELKNDWLIGLHHNSAHADHQFYPDPIFDFHIAGRGDIYDPKGRLFHQIEMDCSNFSPDFFEDTRAEKEKFWDVLAISRDVGFKSLDDMLLIIRKVFDIQKIRVLAIIAHSDLHQKNVGPSEVIKKYLQLFSDEERKYFTMMTPSLDYPFPYDLETLSHYYKNSKLFLHVAKEERHPRVVAYAWSASLPVVAPLQVGSLLSDDMKQAPGFYPYSTIEEAAKSILHILDTEIDGNALKSYADYHLTYKNTEKLKSEIKTVCESMGINLTDDNWILNNLDIRLARHHITLESRNTLNESLAEFVMKLKNTPRESFASLNLEDIEISLHHLPIVFDAKLAKVIHKKIETKIFITQKITKLKRNLRKIIGLIK